MMLKPNKCQRIKSDGQQCGNYKTKGSDYCKFHGGKALKGPQHPNYSHGGYSKLMPKQMAEAILKTEFDPVTISVRAEQDLITARIADLVQTINDLPDAKSMKEINAHWQSLLNTLTSNVDDDKKEDKIIAFDNMIRNNSQMLQSWSELYEATELKRKLVDQEMRIIKTKKHNLSVEEVRVLIDNILSAVRDEIRARTNALLTYEVIADIFMKIEERIRYVLQRS